MVAPAVDDLRLLRVALSGPGPLADRTRDLLTGRLGAPDLEPCPMPNEEAISLRLPAELLRRAEALVERIGATGLRAPRSAVIRMALERGLAVIEAEQGRQPKRRR